LILVSVLDAVFDTISALLRGQFDKRVMLDNLELILLTIDEVVSTFFCFPNIHNLQWKIDHGQIMELDASAVSSRVLMKGSAETREHGGSGNAVRKWQCIMYMTHLSKYCE
jgi:hypothetical protein